MFKTLVLSVLLCGFAVAAPHHLSGAWHQETVVPVVYDSAAEVVVSAAVEPEYTHVGSIVEHVPTAVSHQSRTDYHSTPVVKSVLAPVEYVQPIVHHDAPATHIVHHEAPASIVHHEAPSHIVHHEAPSHIVHHESPTSHIVHHEAPASHIVHHEAPATHIVHHEAPASHIVHHEAPASHIVHHEAPASHIVYHHDAPATYVHHEAPASHIVHHDSAAHYVQQHHLQSPSIVYKSAPIAHQYVNQHYQPLVYSSQPLRYASLQAW